MPQDGIQSVTVPGAVEGWAKLHQRFGKLPWKDLFQPAIYYAEHGYPVTEMISAAWAIGAGQARRRTQNAASVSSARRRTRPSRAQMFRNPGLAAALQADRGRRARRRFIRAPSPKPF